MVRRMLGPSTMSNRFLQKLQVPLVRFWEVCFVCLEKLLIVMFVMRCVAKLFTSARIPNAKEFFQSQGDSITIW